MITIRIEFVYEKDRIFLIKKIKETYKIIDEGDVKPSKNIKSKKKVQYLEIVPVPGTNEK